MLDIEEVIGNLADAGYAKVENFLPDSLRKDLIDFVQTNKFRKKEGLIQGHWDNKKLADTPFEDVTKYSKFNQLCHDLTQRNEIKDPREFFYALRVADGTKFRRPTFYHFDAFYLTVLVPILVPDKTKNNGKLYLYPNVRKIQRYALSNLALKALIQNRFVGYLLDKNFVATLLGRKEFNLDPNYIYFFYGYRTIHGVGFHDEGLRAVGVYHLYDPHEDSNIIKLFRKKYFV